MLQIIMTLILCLFAAVGIVHILNRYISVIFDESKKHLASPYIVITTKNQQENIETIIRSLIWKIYGLCAQDGIFDIAVVDLNSEDDTPVILRQLENEYDFLHIYNKRNYIDKIEREL